MSPIGWFHSVTKSHQEGMNSTAGNQASYSCPLQNVDTIDVLSLPENEVYNRFLVVFISINALTAFLSSFSNFAVIYIILGTKSLRTPSNILILGLAGSLILAAVELLTQPSFCFYALFADTSTQLMSIFCVRLAWYIVWSAWLSHTASIIC